MESYLVDQEILEQFADHLLSEKYPDQPVSNHANTKKEIMRAFDHQVLKDILGNLTKEQGAELNYLLDKTENPAAFEDFFTRHDIDLSAILKNTMVVFRNNFLGGNDNGQS